MCFFYSVGRADEKLNPRHSLPLWMDGKLHI